MVDLLANSKYSWRFMVKKRDYNIRAVTVHGLLSPSTPKHISLGWHCIQLGGFVKDESGATDTITAVIYDRSRHRYPPMNARVSEKFNELVFQASHSSNRAQP